MSDNKTLNHYLDVWDLSNPQLLTQTATSHIYIVTHDTETVILKLLSPWWARCIGAEDIVLWSLNVAAIIEPHIGLL